MHLRRPRERFADTDADRARQRQRLLLALCVTASIMVAELIGGLAANSLALLSDAAHMAVDVAAILIALLGLLIATRPADSRRTFGYYRLEILSALANGVLLTVLAFFIVREAIHRFSNPSAIDTAVVMVVGSIGLTANVVSILLLSRHRGAISTRGAYLHVLGDTISSVGVIVAALIIHYTNWFILDPILSIAIAAVIVFSAYRLIKECVDVLLAGVPLGLEIDHVREEIEKIPGVMSVHDIHIWAITAGMYMFSCHVKVPGDLAQDESDRILTDVKTLLRDQFSIDHSTIQVEGESWQEVGHVH